MRALALFLFTCLNLVALEPLPQDVGAVGLRQTLRRLANPYRVLHIVAHPDDEDGATLTYLSRGRGVDVTIAAVTRGESGANLVTGDFFDGLSVLRTLEYRKAAQHYGTALRFTTFADFGYSKTLEETLKKWDRDGVTADLVRIIREEKPHIVMARFQGGPRDGHGHHQAAGLLAQEAYRAAGDATRYPNAGAPWQPAKLYSNNRREADDWTVKIDSGIYDSLLGMTYAEMARQGLRYQRSQGAGSAIATPGPSVRFYKLLASEVGMADSEQSIFERLDVKLPAAVASAVRDATTNFEIDNPVASLPGLLRGLSAVRRLRGEADSPMLARKEQLFETAAAQALALRLDFSVAPAVAPAGRFSSFMPYETINVATPGESFESTVQLYSGTAMPERVEFHLKAPAGWDVESLGDDRYRVTVAKAAAYSSVHWRRDSVWDLVYEITDPKRWGLALPAPPLSVTAIYWVDGVELHISAPAQASFIDEQRIQRRRDLAVGPAVSVEFPTDAGSLPVGVSDYSVQVNLRNNRSGRAEGALRLKLPAGWSSEPTDAPFTFANSGEQAQIAFQVRPPQRARPGSYSIEAVATTAEAESSAGFKRIHYPGLETAYLARPARHEIRIIDVNTVSGLSVGYVEGTGDDVPQGIRQLGAEVTFLDEAALASSDLSRFDTILVGIRAYAVREDLKAHNARLLDYVENGGVLVVQYSTPEFDHNFGPYPYKMTRRPEEISEEDSPVRILAPDDPVFNWPNRIGSADFSDWVEQRGSKFLVEWDDHYTPLLETHDTGQAPQQGGWVSARHGKGLYVYCAYAWYRQLPYAVPGAVRIFANILALGAQDAPWR